MKSGVGFMGRAEPGMEGVQGERVHVEEVDAIGDSVLDGQSKNTPSPYSPSPVPIFSIFSSSHILKLLSDTYQRYLENQIRKNCPYEGLPIRFDVREQR